MVQIPVDHRRVAAATPGAHSHLPMINGGTAA